MDPFGLSKKMREAGQVIASNPMAQAKVRNAALKTEQLDTRLNSLEHRVLLLEEILAEVANIPVAQLRARIDQELARLEQPRSAEERASETVPCPACQRPVHQHLRHCQICGAQMPPR